MHLLKRHKNRKHKEHKFDYDKMLKEGKDNWKYAVENKVPLDALPEPIAHSVTQYLRYVSINKVVYGDRYFRV